MSGHHTTSPHIAKKLRVKMRRWPRAKMSRVARAKTRPLPNLASSAVMSGHVTSGHYLMLYLVISSHLFLCLVEVISSRVMSCQVMPSLAMPCLVVCHLFSGHVMSSLLVPCACDLFSCRYMSCHDILSHLFSCQVSGQVTSCHVTPCLSYHVLQSILVFCRPSGGVMLCHFIPSRVTCRVMSRIFRSLVSPLMALTLKHQWPWRRWRLAIASLWYWTT